MEQNLVFTKRLPTPNVKPLVYEGMRYEAPNAFGRMGVGEVGIRDRDQTTGI